VVKDLSNNEVKIRCLFRKTNVLPLNRYQLFFSL
jgi:hypothetical protein